jgi:hypothetical protein
MTAVRSVMLSAGGRAELAHYGVPISGYALRLRLRNDCRFCSGAHYSRRWSSSVIKNAVHIGIVRADRDGIQRALFKVDSNNKPSWSGMGSCHSNELGAILDGELMINMM